MSIFGYPAVIKHIPAITDSWGRTSYGAPIEKPAKVVESQKIIRDAKGEEIQTAAEIHLEGVNAVTMNDTFKYTNALGKEITYTVKHYEVKKYRGTDDVKKVVVYG